ncbi:Sterol regulatory element-binding protein ECM22 [Lachnellula suecica]|uniref:Sterol regulatory element-binding protein ECM22 n=1 Tax=Lachnellula suecica TaxID=602035 RepID=A0A8T9C5X9_9HELO|nr:Sterol regulatory element-binding protein ECM22 [Lachnellula suecica]
MGVRGVASGESSWYQCLSTLPGFALTAGDGNAKADSTLVRRVPACMRRLRQTVSRAIVIRSRPSPAGSTIPGRQPRSGPRIPLTQFRDAALTVHSGVSCIYNKVTPNPGNSIPASNQQSVAREPIEQRDNRLANSISASNQQSATREPIEQRDSRLLDDYKSPFSIRIGSDAFNQLRITAFETESFTLPESEGRRKIELRLLQHYITSTSHTFPACHNAAVLQTWSVEVPKLALQYDNLLYPIFSLSALHLLKSEPQNQELIAARQNYVTLTLQQHRRAIAELTQESADAVCFASTLLIYDAFASLQNRVLEPYSPPTEWLQMSRGAGSIYRAAITTFQDLANSMIYPIAMAEPRLQNHDIWAVDENRKPYLGLLSQNIRSEEIWDDETREAYEKTLNYIGSARVAIQNGEHPMGISRRMMAFAVLAPKRFIEAVEQQRPRAWAVLAHFFALGAELQNNWWLGNTVQREIQGIWNVLPTEWRELVSHLL